MFATKGRRKAVAAVFVDNLPRAEEEKDAGAHEIETENHDGYQRTESRDYLFDRVVVLAG